MENLFLLADAAGKASPGTGLGGVFRPSGMCFGKARGECAHYQVGVIGLLVRTKSTLFVKKKKNCI